MDGKNYSAVPPPPSLSSDAKPLDFNSALSKARAIAEKLKQQTSAPVGGDTAPVTPTSSSSSSYQTGSKRSYDDNQDDYRSSSSSQRSYEDERSSKRSAYDGGSSRPLHEPRRYGLGSEERRGNGECSVPNNMVGLIIGKNGENLKKIERMSGCKVQFSDDNGESERKVRLSGEQDQIKIARDMIQQMISDASAANNGNNNNMFNKDPRFSANESQIIKIPSSKVGLVIGRKGETIRDFEERSKAKILMASDGSADKDNERIITLVGDGNAIQHAKKLIEDILYGSENNSFHGGDNRRFGQQGAGGPDFGGDVAGGRYGRGRPNEEHESIRVPVKYVGLIIGKRGETIRTLQEQSGARIKIDNGDGSGDERIVNIFGEPSKVAFAKKLVEDKVAEGAANNAMGGGGRFGGGGNHHYQQHQQHHNNRGGYRQYNYGNYQEGAAPGGDGAENNNNYDYSQYNQYYAQYGYDQYGQQQQQQQQQQGDNQGYQQQYPGYQYGQSYEGYGGATTSTDGTQQQQQQQQKEDVAKAATTPGSGTSNGEKEAGGVDAAYYGQYYANQTPEQQEAYYQWYQQYYGGNGASGQDQQQFNNYDQQQQQQNDNGSSSASPPPPPPPPSSSATATAPPPASASEDSEEKTDNTKDE